MTDEDFIEKRAVFSQFPVDILCSLFPSPLPPPCVCAITADCLKSIKMVVGWWKLWGWDDGSLNARFASHKSAPVLCRHVTAASRNNSYRCAAGRSMMAFAEIRIWWVLTGRRGGGRLDSIQWERRGGGNNGWLLVKKKRAGAVAIQKREDIRWKNYVLVIIITTEHKTQTNKTFLAKGP